MNIVLSPTEVRVLGCLVEKEATTPDAYPLSLNALTTACNQKSNRHPVTELGEGTVLEAVDSLIAKTLITSRGSAGGRVTRYAHRLRDRLLDELSFTDPELALLATLFLRGPQTPGELRARCARIHAFADTAELIATLERLQRRDDGPFVVKLSRQPGHKESRYAHLFCDQAPGEPTAPSPEDRVEADEPSARLDALERRVNALDDELASLRRAFEDLANRS